MESTNRHRVIRTAAKAVGYLLYLGIVSLVLLVLLELGLRVFFGLPKGLFYFTPLGDTSLYRPNARLSVLMMPIPYTVETNSLGFRGHDIAPEKTPGVTRIAAIGDSVTDGYMVDNPFTYPQLMEDYLRAQGLSVEVINAARGGCSIDREYEILRKFVTPLAPDVAVLTFVNNDLYEIKDRTREQLLACDTFEFEPESTSEWLFVARTALGETILDAIMRHTRPNYQAYRRFFSEHDDPAARYAIPGNADHAANVRVFRDKFGFMGLLDPELSTEVLTRVDNYVFVLEHLRDYCRDRGIRLVFVYYPSFAQVYDPAAPLHIRDLLRERVTALGIEFIDTTDAFRSQDPAVPLFLAPIDFHANPAGNRVLAETVGKRLAGIIQASRTP